MKTISIAVAALLAAGASVDARAEGQVYRCGQTYQDTPCENGQLVDTGDARTTEQRRDAHDAARAERQQAKDLVAERQEREKAIKPQRDILRTGAAPAQAASAPAVAAPPGHPKRKTGKGKHDSDEPQYLPQPADTKSNGIK